MLEFEIVARGLYRSDQVTINYDPSLHLSFPTALQAKMDMFWHEKQRIAQQKHTRLFDAPLFRLVETEAQENNILRLVFGDTSYKEYVTTRDPSFFTGRPCSELSNAIGVCSVIETSDGYILLDQRQGVDVYEGRYHVIGGFFERDLDLVHTQPDPFAAINREIYEETGILASDINTQYCLGVVYDLVTPHAEIIFLTQLAIPLSSVYTRTPVDDEIKQIIPLHVTEESLRHFIRTNHANISATGEPNLLLYGALRFGEPWLQNLLIHLS